jgi:hypothetical protein
MGEIGETIGKAIFGALARELAKNPFFAEYEWPILIGIGVLAIVAFLIEQRVAHKKKLPPPVAPKRDTPPRPSRPASSKFIEQFALPISLNTRIPLLLSTITLTVAVFGDMRYDFFELLRVLVFVTSVIVMVALWNAKIVSGWIWLTGTVAILYNPLVTIHLHRGTWVWINIATIILFGTLIILVRNQKPAPDEPALAGRYRSHHE